MTERKANADWTSLAEMLRALHEHGDRPAVIQLHKSTQQTQTYAGLNDLAGCVGAALQTRGCRRGEGVAVMADSSTAWIAAAVGSLRAGAVLTPIDAQMPSDLREHVLRDSEARWLFTTKREAERVEALDLDEPPRLVLMDSDDEQDERSWASLLTGVNADKMDDADPAPDDVAALFYTSGTTGPPKGVPLTHANVLFQLPQVFDAELVREGDRMLLPLPLHHIYAFALGLLAPLALGLPIVLPYALTGRQFARALQEGKVTAIVGVPRLYRAMMGSIERQAESSGALASLSYKAAAATSRKARRHLGVDAGRLLLHSVRQRLAPDLRLCASGGSPLDEDLAWQLEGFGWDVIEGYGLTETSPLVSWNLPGDADFATAGKPLDGVDVRIDNSAVADDDEEDHREKQREGEIQVRGPNVFAGYRHLPDKTDEVFTEDDWFRTGDVGSLDEEGFLHITGRLSSMIISDSGEKVPAEEVEKVYARHDAIEEVGVLQRRGKLVAIVIPDRSAIRDSEQDEQPDEQGALAQRIGEALDEQGRDLPSFQRVTEHVISRQRLPRTRLGKLRRGKLDEHYEKLKEGGDSADEQRGPVSEDEMAAEDRQLLQDPAARAAWETLAVRYSDRRLTPDTRPGAELGVDSLEWLDLSLEIGERSGVQLEEEAIGRVETVRDLLRELTEAEEEGEGVSRDEAIEAPEQTLDEDQQRWLEPHGPFLATTARTGAALNRGVLDSMFDLTVRGVEHVPGEGPVLIAPNHVSHLDPFAVAAALPQRQLDRAYWAGWTGVAFRSGVRRAFSRLAKIVPTDQHQGVLSSLAFGSAVLQRGHILVWFPEGRRSPTGELLPLRAGIGLLLAHHDQAVILPTLIAGSDEALPPGERVPSRVPITVTFGEATTGAALEETGAGDEPHERITAALEERLRALASSVNAATANEGQGEAR